MQVAGNIMNNSISKTVQDTGTPMEVDFSQENAESKATFTFSIENFSKIKKTALSPACMFRNLPWKMMIKPFSSNRAGHRQKSVAFYLQCNGRSSSWSCKMNGSLTIVSQMDGVEDFTKSFEHLFFSKENNWGYGQFMMWNDILDSDKGYIKNDTVIFRAEINVDAPPIVSGDSKKEADSGLSQLKVGRKSANSSTKKTNSIAKGRKTTTVTEIQDGSTDAFQTKNATAVNGQQAEANTGALPVVSSDLKKDAESVLCQSNARRKSIESGSNKTNSGAKRRKTTVVTGIQDGSTDACHAKNAAAANIQPAKINADAPHGVSCDSKNNPDNVIMPVAGNVMNNSLNAEVLKTTTPMEIEFTDENSRSQATFTFTKENFSKIEGSVMSPPCMIRNLPWTIMIQPQLINEANGPQKHLGFYLQCNKDSKSSTWSCKANGSLTIVSQIEGVEDYTKSIQQQFSSDVSNWGFRNFVVWNDLIDPDKGYIKNDTVIFRASVNADAPLGVSCDSKKDAYNIMPVAGTKKGAGSGVCQSNVIQSGEFENYALKLPLQTLSLEKMNPSDNKLFLGKNKFVATCVPNSDAWVTICPRILTDQFIVIQLSRVDFGSNKFFLYIKDWNKLTDSPRIDLYSCLRCEVNDVLVVWLNENGEIKVTKIDRNARVEPFSYSSRRIESGQYQLLGNMSGGVEQIRCFIGDRKAAEPFLWTQATSVLSTLPSDTVKTGSPLFLTCELRGDQIIPIEVEISDSKSEEINQPVPWDDEKLCKVCIDNAANVVIIPCGHLCLCDECGFKMTSRKNSICPICRSIIANTQIVYFS